MMTLLALHPPLAWSEDRFIHSPLYRIEEFDERLLLFPSRSEAEIILENLIRLLGLQKQKTSPTSYLIQKNEVFKALRNFLWIVRKSWRNETVRVIWSTLYIASAKGWENIPLDMIAEVSGIDHAKCREILMRVLDSEKLIDGGVVRAGSRHLVEALELILRSIPTWSEELVMSILCTEIYVSVEDIYVKMRPYGLSIAAIYKIVQRLKKADHIARVRYSRRRPQGPMREVFSPNCRNCFYGYSSQEKCLQHLLVELETYFKENYGKTFSIEERMTLYKSLRMAPFGPRMLRKLLTTLRLVKNVEQLVKDERLAGLLRKLDELCGVKLILPSFEFRTINNIGQNPLM
ncbi:hypothetical protein HRbin02_01112 [Candidatus Calditenuaceae archaeon HR02]|nr:hypothetical protein HRbin02_01112 [Candidatus Calditenuaceae archaeon HR02]